MQATHCIISNLSHAVHQANCIALQYHCITIVQTGSKLLCTPMVSIMRYVCLCYRNRVLGLSNDPSPGYNIEQLALLVRIHAIEYKFI
jgi:hypothetical protein